MNKTTKTAVLSGFAISDITPGCTAGFGTVLLVLGPLKPAKMGLKQALNR